jgi:hypothetical protein
MILPADSKKRNSSNEKWANRSDTTDWGTATYILKYKKRGIRVRRGSYSTSTLPACTCTADIDMGRRGT